jgi:hypothetical protein
MYIIIVKLTHQSAKKPGLQRLDGGKGDHGGSHAWLFQICTPSFNKRCKYCP